MVLGIIDRFQRDCGMLLPWQNQNNRKMYWTKKNKKLPSLLTKNENQRLNSRKPANRGRPQNRKTAVFKCETQKTEPNIRQIRKTEDTLEKDKLRKLKQKFYYDIAANDLHDLQNDDVVRMQPFRLKEKTCRKAKVP